MSDDLIQISVDGKTLQARKGQMLIEVTDQAGITIPRFCYHKKLSIAANCRMCLVDVEKAPKPLPACATPVMPGMVVRTNSDLAKKAQEGTMEFLLINHPLDCPVCDQGGECELQDVALGYGSSVSDYTEGKRVVLDKYIGPLIATEMTRCIHCTRCVRFGEEIAGVRELGATGRGENVRIGTFIEKSVVSELSGNVIDICPVGALTARPSRFTARAWELSQHRSISVHDCVGSNTYIHTDRGRVNRVVPRENEEVNEIWISDRDRFAYQGLSSPERARKPMLRVDGNLQECSWEDALSEACRMVKEAGSDFSALVSAYASTEELYLGQKLVRSMGSNNIDHRVGQSDFSDQDNAPIMPWLGMEFSDLENLDAAFLVGTNIRKEHPIAGLRLRKAVVNGSKVSLLNTVKAPLHFDALHNLVGSPANLLVELASVAMAAGVDLSEYKSLPSIDAQDRHSQIADSLESVEKSCLLLGTQAVVSANFSLIRSLAAKIADKTNSSLVYLPEAANTCGAWLSGCVPHRSAAGVDVAESGLNAKEIMSQSPKTLLLMGVEPELDSADPAAASAAVRALSNVIVITSFVSDEIADYADIVLPQSVYTESSGTYINASGRWQSVRGVAQPLADSRPGWKILRVLGSMLEQEGFDYDSSSAVLQDIQGICSNIILNNGFSGESPDWPEMQEEGLVHIGAISIYATDPVVRRAGALQKTSDAKESIVIHSDVAKSMSLAIGDNVVVKQGNRQSEPMPIDINNTVAANCIFVPKGISKSSALGSSDSTIELEKV